MRKYRQKYYDFFSHFYDVIINLHSRDRSLYLRHYLARKSGVKPENKVLDLCTGTGSVATVLSQYAQRGLVVGVDFSLGMLTKAKAKAQKIGARNLCFVAADAGALPFKSDMFDVVTCSHAMYELTGKTRKLALQEIKRCLKKNGRFCMMEHEEPKQPLIRLLYYLRLLSMGKEGREIVRHELSELRRIFSQVVKETTASGRTKLICGEKGRKD
ncbi:MAG: class I SAM-dependent methyltransferase [Candidatus Desulfofervidaceae bacterium]|nr:class I SAM-dependent methyltransferase [Candidatus Desulfofervidaceae bacterium]